MRIGDAVASPGNLTELERQLLVEAHGDAIRLVRVVWPGRGHLRWEPRSDGPLA